MDKDKEDKKFSILDSILSHVKRIIDLHNKNIQEHITDSIVSIGRTYEEKEQLKEMCEEEELYEKRLAELRQSNLEPGEWLNKFIDQELDSSCDSITSEAIDIVKQMIMDETGKAIKAQAKCLDVEMEQTTNIAQSVNSIKGE